MLPDDISRLFEASFADIRDYAWYVLRSADSEFPDDVS
jgi:hypothetical protein